MVVGMTNKLLQRLTVMAIGGALTSVVRRSARRRPGTSRDERNGHVAEQDVRVLSGLAHHPVRLRREDGLLEGAGCAPVARRMEDVVAGTAPVDMSSFEAQFRENAR
jgi:hypothetical protein